MSRSLAKLAMLVACLSLVACGSDPQPANPGSGGSGGNVGPGGTGGGGTGGTGGTIHHCTCGNGIEETDCNDGSTPEQCDDGNSDDTDDCLSTCENARCGDGHLRAGIEQCDDGANNSDTLAGACRTNCALPYCGDGVIDAGELCDDGNFADGDDCRSDCTPPACGDGRLDPGEECDDGNTVDTDACSNSCENAYCGDGIVGPGEICDDGNFLNSDSCTDQCKPNVCGDANIWQDVEACDDGNKENDDGCRNDCTLPSCGDGRVDPGEDCDDANHSNTDACLNSCLWAHCGDGEVRVGPGGAVLEACDWAISQDNPNPPSNCRSPTNTTAGNLACTIAVCGDGVADFGDNCDDGNQNDNDSCLSTCQVATCGDGALWTGHEQCDTGAARSDTAPNACRSDCKVAHCGDGVVDTNEVCDDGNRVDGDNCTNACQLPTCGDGITWTGHEQCDDGNAVLTDGCTVNCTAATCGDGYVRTGVEQCDPGLANLSDTTPNACRTNCKNAFCGDGVKDSAEACDDANTSNADSCLTTCVQPLTVAFTGFDTTRVDTRTRVTVNGTLPAAFVGTTNVRWKLTVTDNSGATPVSGVKFYYRDTAIDADVHEVWTNFVATDSTGVALMGTAAGFPASQLQASGGLTTPFSAVFTAAGNYRVTAELVNVATSGTIGTANTTFTVAAWQSTISFNGFDTLDARYRGPVVINGKLVSTYSTSAHVRWRFTVTNNSNVAVAGVRAYYNDANPTADVNTFTTFTETDANGQAMYGPTAGTLVSSTTLETAAGQDRRFGLLFRNPGSYHVRAELLNVDNSTVIGTNVVRFTVDIPTLTIAFNGYNTLNAVDKATVSQTVTLDSSYSATNNVVWKMILTKGSSNTPVVGARAYYQTGTDPNPTTWTSYIETDSNGVAAFGAPSFPASVLQVAGGKTTPFYVDYSTLGAGNYRLWLELDDVTTSTTTVVGYDELNYTVRPVSMTFSTAWASLLANVRGQVNYRAKLDPTNTSTNLSWRITVLNGSTAVSGVNFYSYNPSGASDDITDHLTWSTARTTNASGQIQTSTFAASTLQGTNPTTVPYSVSFATAGTYTVKVELMDGTNVIDTYTTTATVR